MPKECQKCQQQWREVDGVLRGGRKEKELHRKVVAHGGQPGGEKGKEKNMDAEKKTALLAFLTSKSK